MPRLSGFCVAVPNAAASSRGDGKSRVRRGPRSPSSFRRERCCAGAALVGCGQPHPSDPRGRHVLHGVGTQPGDPSRQFVSAGKAPSFRISESLSVRMLGREAKLTPGWSYSAQTFQWAAVQTTDGQAMEVGVYRWPAFNIVRDDTGKTEVNNLSINQLATVAAVTRPATLPGLAPGARALVTRADGSYEGTVVLDPNQKNAFTFVRLDTNDQRKLRLQHIHRLTKTGRTEAGLDVVEVQTRDAQVFTIVYSRSAFNLDRADTGKREVNSQGYAAFKAVEARGEPDTAARPVASSPAGGSVPAVASASAPAADAEEFPFQPVSVPPPALLQSESGPMQRIEVTVMAADRDAVESGAVVLVTDGVESSLDTCDERGVAVFDIPIEGRWTIRAKSRSGATGEAEVDVSAPVEHPSPSHVVVLVRKR